jgi:hypothetical protein
MLTKLKNKLKNEGANLNNLDNWSMSIEGFNWILENITKGSKILEIGAGKGTIELNRFYNVTTVENDKRWVGSVEGVEYIYAPLDPKWYKIENLKNKLPKKYDLLIIDGPQGSPNRIPILDNLNLFYLECPILIDDVHAEASLHIAEVLAKKLNRELTVHKGWQKKFATIL